MSQSNKMCSSSRCVRAHVFMGFEVVIIWPHLLSDLSPALLFPALSSLTSAPALDVPGTPSSWSSLCTAWGLLLCSFPRYHFLTAKSTPPGRPPPPPDMIGNISIQVLHPLLLFPTICHFCHTLIIFLTVYVSLSPPPGNANSTQQGFLSALSFLGAHGA